MVFKNAPATFDRVIFAIVRRIVSQYDFKVVFVSKADHSFHELCPMTGVLWTVKVGMFLVMMYETWAYRIHKFSDGIQKKWGVIYCELP